MILFHFSKHIGARNAFEGIELRFGGGKAVVDDLFDLLRVVPILQVAHLAVKSRQWAECRQPVKDWQWKIHQLNSCYLLRWITWREKERQEIVYRTLS